MAGPITWRNVTGPSVADASRPMSQAAQSFDGMFDVFNKALTRQQDAMAYARDQQNEAAKQGYLDMLQGATTPEALAQLQQSGALAAQREGMAPAVLAAIRGADDARLGTLRTQLKQAGEYEDFSRDRAERGDVDAIQSQIFGGDFGGARQRLDAVNLRNEAALYKSMTDAENANTRFGWDRSKAEHEQSMRPLDIRAKEASIANSTNQSEVQRLQAEALIEQRQQAINEKAMKARQGALDAYIGTTAWDGGGINTEEGMTNFTKQLKGMGVGDDQQADILYNLSKHFPNGTVQVGKDESGLPITMPVPVSTALQAVAGSGEQWGAGLVPGWSRRGDDMAVELATRLKDPKIYEIYKGISQGRRNLLDGSGLFKDSDSSADPEAAAASFARRIEEQIKESTKVRESQESEKETKRQQPFRPLSLNWRELNQPRN